MSEAENKAPKAEKTNETVRPFKSAAEATTQAAEHAKSALHGVQERVAGTVHEFQGRVTESFNEASKAAREAYEFQRGAVETMIEAGRIYGEGLQGLVTHAANVNRAQFEETVSALRSLMTTRSFSEAVKLQTELARAVTSRALTEGSKMVHDYLSVTEKAVAPLTAKAEEAAQKISKAA